MSRFCVRFWAASRHPAYFAGSESILLKPVPDTVLTALEAVSEGLDREPVFRYLKSALSPLDPAACDRLENYVITWGLGGKAWGEDFTQHPRGLGLPWEPEDEAALEDLNQSRRAGVQPLVRLHRAMAGARNTLGQLEALHAFLEEVEAPGGWRSWPPPLRRRGTGAAPWSKSSSGTFWWGRWSKWRPFWGRRSGIWTASPGCFACF